MTLVELSQPTESTAALVASVCADGATAVVTLRGEADIATRPVVVDVLARVIAESDGPVIVDLARTELIDSGSALALARAWQFLDARGRTLAVRSPSRMALRVLTLLGLAHLIEPDPDDRHLTLATERTASQHRRESPCTSVSERSF